MTDMPKDKPHTLANRVEASEGPSRELDREIARLIHGDGWNHHSDTRYTASLDAAMTLIPADHEWSVEWGGNSIAIVRHLIEGPEHRGYAEAPALALCAAALRARGDTAAVVCVSCGDDCCIDEATELCDMCFEHIMGEEPAH